MNNKNNSETFLRDFYKLFVHKINEEIDIKKIQILLKIRQN